MVNATGMNAATGRSMGDMDHIRQSIRDILTTRIGSRVMRRDYGSLLPELIDQPANPANRLRLMAATVMAIIRWEPRVRVTKATFTVDADGTAVVDMDAVRRDGPRSNQAVSLAVRL